MYRFVFFQDISADIQSFQDELGRAQHHGNIIRQEQNGRDRSWNLPNEFVGRLNRVSQITIK